MLSLDEEESTGSTEPAARRHRDALERGEAHRRVHRAAAADGGHRATTAEVTDDQAQTWLGRPRARRPLDAPLHGQSVETVAADAHSSRQIRGSAYVAASAGIVRGTRCRIRPRAAPREGRARGSIPARAGVLWSGAIDRARRSSEDGLVDGAGSTSRAAVDDPVTDGLDPDEWSRATRLPARSSSERAELQARRAGVDDEDRSHALRTARPSRGSRMVFAVLPRLARACGAGRSSPGEMAAPAPRPGTRSTTSITRWNRSRSLSITMSNGVVVVPSSL